MVNQKSIIVCVLGILASWQVLAAGNVNVPSQPQIDDGIQLGNPAYGGNGCPAGSASVALSPDATALSILFDQYVVEAGRAVAKSMDRKSCNIAIPVHVPQGLSVSLIAIDYRGFNSLPVGADSRFQVEYFFAGSRSRPFIKTFTGARNEDYILSNKLEASAIVWSPCGADVNLRANTSMMVRSNSRGEQALSTVDSMDIEAGIVYQLQWKRCGF